MDDFSGGGRPSGREPQASGGIYDERALFVISVAAELAGVHPQTLRIYERKGLISPARTSGRSRRYSERDIARRWRFCMNIRSGSRRFSPSTSQTK